MVRTARPLPVTVSEEECDNDLPALDLTYRLLTISRQHQCTYHAAVTEVKVSNSEPEPCRYSGSCAVVGV